MRWTRQRRAMSGDGRAGHKARELTNGTLDERRLARQSLWLRRGAAYGEVVWFWHPLLVLNSRRRVSPTGLGQPLNPRMTVTRRIRRRGEHEGNRKTIARGMPGVSGVTVVTTLVCFILFSHARLRVRRAPG